jgi:RNA polymerase sigma factor (sigma-70 family)
MKIPPKMTQDEVMTIINKVCKKLAPKFVFAHYEVEDLQQEAFMIALEALERFDNTKSLQTFLYTHVGNRLKNFKRDNYYRVESGPSQAIQERKRNLLEATDVDDFRLYSSEGSILDSLEVDEIMTLIDIHLPAEMRADYIRLKTNSSLPKNRKEELVDFLKELIDEKG